MIKKLYSIILAICIAASCAGTAAFAAGEGDTSKAVKVLTGLGYFDYEQDLLTGEMTRAEFADIIAAMTGLSENIHLQKWYETFYGDAAEDFAPEKTGGIFADVGGGHWAHDSIEAVKTAGYMNGDTAGNFNPDRPITYEESAAVIINVLGYDTITSQYGEWPNGYLSVANSIGLTKKISASYGQKLTRQQAGQMLYNMLDIPLFSDYNYNGGYKQSDEKTFLNDVLKLEFVKGQMTANAVTTLSLDVQNADDYIEIDGKAYASDDDTVQEMIGRRVEAYYSIDDDTDGDIVFAYTTDDDDITVIDLAKDHNFTGGRLTYKSDRGNKTVSIQGKPVIFNGAALTVYDDSLFDYDNGSVIITDGNETDVVIVKVCENIYISVVDAENQTVYDRISGKTLSLKDDDKKIIITDNNGEKREFAYLVPGLVLSVMQNNKKCTVYASDKTVSGEVKSINDDENTVGIDGTSYKVCREFKGNSMYNALNIGQTVKAFMNIDGNIVWVEFLSKTGIQNAYMMRMYNNEDEETVSAKVFDRTGKVVKYNLKDKVSILRADDTKERLHCSLIYDELKNYTGFLKIKLNDKEEITEFEIPGTKEPEIGETRDYLMYEDRDGTGMIYASDSCTFTNMAALATDTFIVGVPSDPANESKYQLLSRSDFKDQQHYMVKCYGNRFGSLRSEAVVTSQIETNSYGKIASNIWVVMKRYTGINDDNEIIDCALLSNAKEEKTVYARREETDASGNTCSLMDLSEYPGKNGTLKIKKGDMVLCITDSDNYIKRICTVFDHDQRNTENGKSGGVPGVNNDLFYVPSEYVDTVAKTHTARAASFGATTNSNPFAVGTDPVTWNVHLFYPQSSVSRIMLGYVYYNNDDSLVYTTQDLSNSAYVSGGVPNEISTIVRGTKEYTGIYFKDFWNKQAVVKPSIMVVTYDGDSNVSVKSGSYNDIRDYISAGRSCSRILTRACSNTGYQAVIINDNR